jgi:hypothetical protein
MLFRTLRVSTGCRPDAYANGSEEYASTPFPFCIISQRYQILGEIHTSAMHGREPVALAYEMAVCALQLGLKFRMHPSHNDNYYIT